MNEIMENDRIDSVLKSRWINYPKADEIVKALELLLRFPKSDRMQNLLIIGESNNGKTTLAKKFVRQNQPYLETIVDPATDYAIEIVVRPVIMVQCPHIPHERSLYYNILDQLNLPYRKSTRPEYLKQTVINAFIDMKVKVLILDEIHFFLQGSPMKQREILNLIRYISNQAQVSIVALGTIEASYTLKAERQLDTRFDKIVIPQWKYDMDFLRLLVSIESVLPLKEESKLKSPDLSKEIYRLSHGILGEMIKLIRLAALRAMESGEEKITLKTLSEIAYSSPFENTAVTI